VATPDQVRTFNEYNFNVESLRNAAHGECWINDGIIVALGSDMSRKKALKVMRQVMKTIKREIEKGRRYR
jgi:hypothetical protein